MPLQMSSSNPSNASSNQPRMPEHALDDRGERAEPQAIAGVQRRRRRSPLGRRAMVPRAEGHRDEPPHPLPRQRAAPGQPHLDGGRRRFVLAGQAGRQRRGVVGDDDVAGPHQVRQIARAAMDDAAVVADDEESRGRAARAAGRGHGDTARLAARSRAPAVARSRASIARRSRRRRPGPLQRAAMGVGHRERVHRRVHVAWIDRDGVDAEADQLLAPDAREVTERRLAHAVGAPVGIRRLGGIARDVEDQRRPRVARGRGQRAEQRLGQAEGPTTFVASAASRSSQSVSASGTSGTGPSDEALLTRTSSPPSAAVICIAIG